MSQIKVATGLTCVRNRSADVSSHFSIPCRIQPKMVPETRTVCGTGTKDNTSPCAMRDGSLGMGLLELRYRYDGYLCNLCNLLTLRLVSCFLRSLLT